MDKQVILLASISVNQNTHYDMEWRKVLENKANEFDAHDLNVLIKDMVEKQISVGFDFWVSLHLNFMRVEKAGSCTTYTKVAARSFLINFKDGKETLVRKTKASVYTQKSLKDQLGLINKTKETKTIFITYGHGSILGLFSATPPNVEVKKCNYFNNTFKGFIAKTFNYIKIKTNLQVYDVMLNTTLSNILSETIARETKIDILVHYCCCMQNTETMYAFRDVAKVMVASPTGIRYPYLDLGTLLGTSGIDDNLKWASSLIKPPILNVALQDAFKDKPYMLSAIDLSNVDELVEKFKDWVEELESNGLVVSELANFKMGLSLDSRSITSSNTLYLSTGFVKKLSDEKIPEKANKEKTVELLKFLTRIGNIVYVNDFVEAEFKDNFSGAETNGVSIFLPNFFPDDLRYKMLKKTKAPFIYKIGLYAKK